MAAPGRPRRRDGLRRPHLARAKPLQRWLGPLYALLTVLLVGQCVLLSTELPERALVDSWRAAWLGLGAIAAALAAATAIGTLHRAPWALATLGATAAAILGSAWLALLTRYDRLDGKRIAPLVADVVVALGLAAFAVRGTRRLLPVRAAVAAGGTAPVPSLVPLPLLPALLWIALRLVVQPGRHVAAGHALAHNWRFAWIGFDVLLALVLAGVALAGLRRHPASIALLGSAAALLVCDAWFDVATSRTRSEVLVAIASAACAELPIATLSVLAARRAVNRVRAADADFRLAVATAAADPAAR